MEIFFILTEPQMGENIGAAARVMANFNFENLRIVNPRDGWPNQVAEYMATSGKYVLDQANIYNTLEDATNDLDFTFAFCGKDVFLNKPIVTLNNLNQQINNITKEYNIKKIGLIYGCERVGLSKQQISLCNNIVNIPTGIKCSSMNLAQAVAVTCYELLKFEEDKFTNFHSQEIRKTDSAEQGEINFMLNKLMEYLTITNFFQEENKKHNMEINIRNMFNKNQYSKQEVRTIIGIFRSLFEYK